jgi:hypothetical protein
MVTAMCMALRVVYGLESGDIIYRGEAGERGDVRSKLKSGYGVEAGKYGESGESW